MVENRCISIIVPLFNKGPYVERALESIINQTYSSFETIVVNDGSTDDGPKVVKKLTARNDRIHLITQTNSGPAAARNRGIKETKGSFIAFLDADDEWAPHFLELAVSTFHAHPSAAAAALAYRIIYPNGSGHVPDFQCGVPVGATGIVENYFQAVLDGAPPICTPSVVIRRAVFEQLGGFPPLRRGQDTAFWGTVALHYPIAFANVVSATCHLDADKAYRATLRLVPVNEDDAKHVLSPLDEALSGGLLPDALASAVRRYRHRRLAEMIRQNLMCGRPDDARRLFAAFGHDGTVTFLHEPRVPLYLAATFLPPIFPNMYWNLHYRLWAALKR